MDHFIAVVPDPLFCQYVHEDAPDKFGIVVGGILSDMPVLSGSIQVIKIHRVKL